MTRKVLKLAYPSFERFKQDYAHIQKGLLFAPMSTPLPLHTMLHVQIVIPGIEDVFMTHGEVVKSYEPNDPNHKGVMPGVVLVLDGEGESLKAEIEMALRSAREYRMLDNDTNRDRAKGTPATENGRPAVPSPDPLEFAFSEIDEIRSRPHAGSDDHAPKADAGDGEGIEMPLDLIDLLDGITPRAMRSEPPTEQPVPPSGVDEHEPVSETDDHATPEHFPEERPAVPEIPEDIARAVDRVARSTLRAEPQDSVEIADTDALSLKWIREVVEFRADAADTEEVEEDPPPPPPPRKKKFSEEEAKIVVPVGEFIMELTRAMLRTGYYEGNHPGHQKAKTGLFRNFQQCLAKSHEIMLTAQPSHEKGDIMITGILDEPFSIYLMTSAGKADLFVPRLLDYFQRKGLLSFAIKKRIREKQFEAFIDIMCDPRYDISQNEQAGEMLTLALVEKRIADVSIVFAGDHLALEVKLPWRVEMTMQRLAKDLGTIPWLQDRSEEELNLIKHQLVQDILRPLRQPHLLKDIVLHCNLIAKHIKRLKPNELERIVVEAAAPELLRQAAVLAIKEIESVARESKKDSASRENAAWLQNVKRIMRIIAARLVMEKISGAHHVLEQLHLNGMMTFDELPAAAKYRVGMLKMVRDVQQRPEAYVSYLLKTESRKDALVFLKWFQRVAPPLVEAGSWSVLLGITRAANRLAAKKTIFPDAGNPTVNPFVLLLHDFADQIAAAYDDADHRRRRIIDDLVGELGHVGIKILSSILHESEKKDSRKAALTSFGKKGALALRWVRQLLDDPGKTWYLHRNGLLILSHVGDPDEDMKRTRLFLLHPHERVREEALKTAIAFQPENIDHILIASLKDSDEGVRSRAITALEGMTSLSEESFQGVLETLLSDPPLDKTGTAAFYKTTARLILRIGAFETIPHANHFELALMKLILNMMKRRKWYAKLLKSDEYEEIKGVLTAAVTVLEKIGGADARAFLQETGVQKKF